MIDGSGYTPVALGERLRAARTERGARSVGGAFARWGAELVAGLPRTLRGRGGSFTLGSRRYRYAYRRYKFSWLTERAVEVPVVQALVDEHHNGPVLEVGNVLSHYRAQRHLVIDKYERAAGVLNRDVLELDDGLGRFGLIVAISTLEHVGRDEEPRDPGGAARALDALRKRLAPGGRLAITVPAGYNPAFDAHLRSGKVKFAELRALARTAPGPHWEEVEPEAAWERPYDYLLYSARAVVFGVIDAPEASPRSS